MKKISFILLFLTSIFFFSGFTFTGTDFEGKVTYSISVDNPNMPPQAKAMIEGSEVIVYIKGTKSRADVNMGFQNTTTITDTKANTSVMLMEVMGNKYKIKPDDKKDTEKKSDVSVKYLDDTKEIAGYKCKKAEITFKDNTETKQTTTIYYTEEISNHMGYDSRNSQFKDIKGMPLEYEIQAQNGMKMKMSAKSVNKESVPENKFDIPSDYKETTMEQVQQDMQKMMQQGGQH